MSSCNHNEYAQDTSEDLTHNVGGSVQSEDTSEDKRTPDTGMSADKMLAAQLSDSTTNQRKEDDLRERESHEGTTTESNGTSQQLGGLREDQHEHTSETVNCSQSRNTSHETAIGGSTPSNHSLDLVDGNAAGSLEEFATTQPITLTGSPNQQPRTTSTPPISDDYSSLQSPSSVTPLNSVQPQGTSSSQNPTELRTFVSLSVSSPETLSLPSSPDVLQIEESGAQSDSGRSSPYMLISKGSMADASKFETSGLLYARATADKHNRDLMRPADEVAEDVLEAFGEEVHVEGTEGGEAEADPRRGGGEQREVKRESDDQPQQEEGDSESQEEPLPLKRFERKIVPIDPGALMEIERHAQTVAAELSHVMDNLRNSLHAMSMCTKQTVQLHRESVDKLHQVVDANVKAMYSFMAKFEELNKCLAPVQQIAVQIHEINESLRILERNF